MNVVEHCPARAALAGNPSDGYGGAVVAVPVRQRRATVTVEAAPTFVFASTDGVPPTSFADLHELEAAAAGLTPDHTHALAIATVADVAERWGAPTNMQITVGSSIPRSVGLAGSSAIVIAALRATLRAGRLPLPHPDLLASVARSIEVDRLGITAGLQDRVVQAWERPMSMSFRPRDMHRVEGLTVGTAEPVDIPDDALLLVAWRPSSSAPSQTVHDTLATRFEKGDADVRAAMVALAEAADAAREAIAAGDVTALGRAMDRTFDLRATVVDLDPSHVAMVDAARSVGANANYTGSGGSVIVLAHTAHMLDEAERALRSLPADVFRC